MGNPDILVIEISILRKMSRFKIDPLHLELELPESQNEFVGLWSILLRRPTFIQRFYVDL